MKKLLLQIPVVMFIIVMFSSCSYGSQIEGVWETNLNGTYFVVLYSENEYCCWLNNQVAETGIFIIDGDTIFGMADNGAPFENTFQLSDDLSHLLVVRQDGYSFFFSRKQNNVRRSPTVMRRKNTPIRRRCSMCRGSGICQVCFSKRRFYVPDYSGSGSGSYVTCKGCHGSGKCWRCNGKGR